MSRSDVHPVTLVAALRTEIAPLLRSLSCRRIRKEHGLLLHWCSIEDEEILILETGMGPERVAEGVRWLLKHYTPLILISMGFSGGLTEKLVPGDTIYGIRSVQYEVGTSVLDRVRTLNSKALGTSLPQWLHPGTIVTSNAPPNKRKLEQLLPEEWNPAVVDMETAHLTRIAETSSVPFVYIRAVCDEFDLEPDLRIERMTDEMGRIRLAKVFRYVLLEPTVIARLARLAPRAGIAARALERVVMHFLEQHI